MKDLKGKTAYITGGSSGIGLATAKLLASKGVNVAIFARRQPVLESALKEISSCAGNPGQKFYYAVLDVSRHEDVGRVLQKAVEEFGLPDMLINCAGRARPGYFRDISYSQFEETIKIDLYGTWNTCALLAPRMKRGSSIVNTSSVVGFIGVFGYSDYAAAKFGVIGLSETLRSELKPQGITVSILCPPDTDTPGYAEENRTKPPETVAVSDVASIMKPEQVAAALVTGMLKGRPYIVPSANARFTWIGKRLAPWLAELVMDFQIRGVQKQKKSG